MTSKQNIQNFSVLSDEELVALAQQKDRNAVTEILSRYRPFVKMSAMHYSGSSMETDDIVQEGFIGLLSAVYTYSPKKNTAFKTYCAACVNNAARSAVRADLGMKNSPLNSYIPIDDVELAASFSPEQLVISEESAVFIRSLIETKLSELENEVLKLHIIGMDYKTIAKKLGTGEKTVDNALQRIRKKLSRELNKN